MNEDLIDKIDPPYKNKHMIMLLRKFLGQLPLLACISEEVTWLAPSTIPGCILEQTDIPKSIINLINYLFGTQCYNCLGWAISENKWLVIPAKRFSNEEAVGKEISAFLTLHLEIKNRNLFDVTAVKKFDLPSIHLENPKEGAAAFYFNTRSPSGPFLWSHAAKYAESIIQNNEITSLNQWTSKLGMMSLVAHKKAETINCVYNDTKLILYANPLEYIGSTSSKEVTLDYDHQEL